MNGNLAGRIQFLDALVRVLCFIIFLFQAAGAQCHPGDDLDPDPGALLHLLQQGAAPRGLQARPRSHQARRQQAQGENIFGFVKLFYISMFSGCPHQVRQQEVHEGGGASRLAGRGRAEAGQEAARESVDRTAVQHVM